MDGCGHDHRFPCQRFSIVGRLEASGLVEAIGGCTSPLPLEELDRKGPGLRAACLGATRASDDPELDAEVARITDDEVDKGWFLGPFTMEDLDRTLPGRIPARRFGVRQGQKVRAIDEFSAFLHNAMVSTRAAST